MFSQKKSKKVQESIEQMAPIAMMATRKIETIKDRNDKTFEKIKEDGRYIIIAPVSLIATISQNEPRQYFVVSEDDLNKNGAIIKNSGGPYQTLDEAKSKVEKLKEHDDYMEEKYLEEEDYYR